MAAEEDFALDKFPVDVVAFAEEDLARAGVFGEEYFAGVVGIDTAAVLLLFLARLLLGAIS